MNKIKASLFLAAGLFVANFIKAQSLEDGKNLCIMKNTKVPNQYLKS
jgi:hypothetical protein